MGPAPRIGYSPLNALRGGYELWQIMDQLNALENNSWARAQYLASKMNPDWSWIMRCTDGTPNRFFGDLAICLGKQVSTFPDSPAQFESSGRVSLWEFQGDYHITGQEVPLMLGVVERASGSTSPLYDTALADLFVAMSNASNPNALRMPYSVMARRNRAGNALSRKAGYSVRGLRLPRPATNLRMQWDGPGPPTKVDTAFHVRQPPTPNVTEKKGVSLILNATRKVFHELTEQAEIIDCLHSSLEYPKGWKRPPKGEGRKTPKLGRKAGEGLSSKPDRVDKIEEVLANSQFLDLNKFVLCMGANYVEDYILGNLNRGAQKNLPNIFPRPGGVGGTWGPAF